MNRLTALLGCVLLAHAIGANAQTYFVDDRLQIGLHAQPTLSSPILELLSSGTALQLLERNAALARVRTDAGLEGWVDGAYINAEQPARTRVRAMEAELAGAQAALADLQAKVVAMEQRPEQQMASERAAEQGDALLSTDTLREMQLLAKENQRLKQQIAEFEAVHRMAQERAAAVAESSNTGDGGMLAASAIDIDDGVADVIDVTALKQWHLILVASILLLFFSIGGWLVDWSVRRRHGGFRV